jgi:L-lactate dehydrogenase complex protein LldF
MKIMAGVLSHPSAYKWMGKIARISMRILPNFMFDNNLNPWTKNRKMPNAPKESFQEWFKNRKS